MLKLNVKYTFRIDEDFHFGKNSDQLIRTYGNFKDYKMKGILLT